VHLTDRQAAHDKAFRLLLQEGFTRLWRGTGAGLAIAVPTVSCIALSRIDSICSFKLTVYQTSLHIRTTDSFWYTRSCLKLCFPAYSTLRRRNGYCSLLSKLSSLHTISHSFPTVTLTILQFAPFNSVCSCQRLALSENRFDDVHIDGT
jgi:hypothetical protein